MEIEVKNSSAGRSNKLLAGFTTKKGIISGIWGFIGLAGIIIFTFASILGVFFKNIPDSPPCSEYRLRVAAKARGERIP